MTDTLAGLDAYPAYYAHMAPTNSAGPRAPDLSAPVTADKETLAARIAGEWVVDLRTRTAFAAGHVTGTLNFGVDHLEGAATGPPDEWTDSPLGTFERTAFPDLAQVRHHREVAVLDVRRASGYDAGHVENAVNIPLHELLQRIDEVPSGEVWVHCAGGYRASIAASVLAARGIPVVAVDDSYGENAASSGLPVTEPAERRRPRGATNPA